MQICTYCGEIATTQDHVIPWSWNHTNTRKRSGEFARDQDLTPCCFDCNARLHNVPLFNIKDRAWHLVAKLQAKLKKAMKAEWSLDELAELGTKGFLRGHVERSILERDSLIRRIAHLQAHDEEVSCA